MNFSKINKKQYLFFGSVGYFLAFFLFIFVAKENYTYLTKLLAWLLFVLGTLPTLFYFASKKNYFPVIELVLLTYVNAFSIPIFFENELIMFSYTITPENTPVTPCLLLANLAICTLWLGFKWMPIILRHIPLSRLKFKSHPTKLFYYATFISFFSLVTSGNSTSISGLIDIIASQDLAVAMLALLYYMNLLKRWQNFFTLLLVTVFVLKGVASGMATGILQPLMIWLLCRWMVTRKFEKLIFVIGILVFVVLQPVKLQYRQAVWFGNQSLSYVEKIGVFSTIFITHWGGNDELSSKIDDSTANRTSLLLQTSHVINLTPEVVPYKNGETLYYFLVTWIPRFMWPDKPIAQEANIKYALDYGVTTSEGIKTTMFGVGTLGEVFMNFGTIGVIPSFIFLGMLTYLCIYFINIPISIMSNVKANNLENYIASLSLLLAVVMKIIFIGSAIAHIYGGLFQLIIIQGGLMYLFTRDKTVRLIKKEIF